MRKLIIVALLATGALLLPVGASAERLAGSLPRAAGARGPAAHRLSCHTDAAWLRCCASPAR